VTIRKVIELGVGVGTEKAIGYGLRGLAGEEVRFASVGPRPSLPRIDIAAESAEDFVLLTDLLLQLRFRPLTLELLGLGPGRTALNLDSSPQ
jgi:hypothetical protein